MPEWRKVTITIDCRMKSEEGQQDAIVCDYFRVLSDAPSRKETFLLLRAAMEQYDARAQGLAK